MGGFGPTRQTPVGEVNLTGNPRADAMCMRTSLICRFVRLGIPGGYSSPKY